MEKNVTCCFTGHRNLPKKSISKIIKHLDYEVENLLNQGVTNFISGGALGFDQIAASLIIVKKQMRKDIRLIFALPCKNQENYWTDEQKSLYHLLLAEADEVIYVSEEYYEGCMKLRNRYMVDKSSHCICAIMKENSGTGQIIRYARERGVKILNMFK